MGLTAATKLHGLRISGLGRERPGSVNGAWSVRYFTPNNLRPYVPAGDTRWSTIRHYPLHPVRLGPEIRDIVNVGHFGLMRDLGIGGIGLVNPHPNLIPGFVQHAIEAGHLAVDLQSFLVIPFWRDDALRADYGRWSTAISQAMDACAPNCPDVLWNVVDEPGIHDRARCVRDLTTRADRVALISPLDEFASALCDDGLVCLHGAATACDAAFPELLAGLLEELQGEVPDGVAVGLNLTGDTGQRYLPTLDGRLDYSSFTNNWVGRVPPAIWPLVQLKRRVAEGALTPFIGYNVFGATGWMDNS